MKLSLLRGGGWAGPDLALRSMDPHPPEPLYYSHDGLMRRLDPPRSSVCVFVLLRPFGPRPEYHLWPSQSRRLSKTWEGGQAGPCRTTGPGTGWIGCSGSWLTWWEVWMKIWLDLSLRTEWANRMFLIRTPQRGIAYSWTIFSKS